jgi:hypothetical protein
MAHASTTTSPARHRRKPFSDTSSFMPCVPASATGVSRFVRERSNLGWRFGRLLMGIAKVRAELGETSC